MTQMIRIFHSLVAVFAVARVFTVPVCAEERIALVVTNQNYVRSSAKLSSPHRDGALMRAALEKANFKVWTLQDITNERALVQAVGEHVKRLADAGPEAVGFLYYSGHGAADRPDGTNYLIPTDAPIDHVSQLELMAVRLDRITSALAQVGRLNFVVFDACRNIPLQRAAKDLAFKGFAPVKEQNGMLVAYATTSGSIAADQSLYATALAEELVRPGVEASQAFRAVSRRVLQSTRNLQAPEYLDKRLHDFHFVAVAKSESAVQFEPQLRLPSPAERRALTITIQENLRRVGCLAVPPTGNWLDQTKAAAQKFNVKAAEKIEASHPTPEALAVLQRTNIRMCDPDCGALPVGSDGTCVAREVVCSPLRHQFDALTQGKKSNEPQITKLTAEISTLEAAVLASEKELSKGDCYEYFLFSKSLKRTPNCLRHSKTYETARSNLTEKTLLRNTLSNDDKISNTSSEMRKFGCEVPDSTGSPVPWWPWVTDPQANSKGKKN